MEHLLRRLGLIESFSVRVASAKLFSDWFSKSVEIDPWDTTDRRKKQYKGSIDESGFEIRNKGERIPAFGGISFAKAIGRTRQSEDGFLVEVQIQLAPEQAMMFAAGCVIVTFLYIIPIGQLLDGDIELGMGSFVMVSLFVAVYLGMCLLYTRSSVRKLKRELGRAMALMKVSPSSV